MTDNWMTTQVPHLAPMWYGTYRIGFRSWSRRIFYLDHKYYGPTLKYKVRWRGNHDMKAHRSRLKRAYAVIRKLGIIAA